MLFEYDGLGQSSCGAGQKAVSISSSGAQNTYCCPASVSGGTDDELKNQGCTLLRSHPLDLTPTDNDEALQDLIATLVDAVGLVAAGAALKGGLRYSSGMTSGQTYRRVMYLNGLGQSDCGAGQKAISITSSEAQNTYCCPVSVSGGTDDELKSQGCTLLRSHPLDLTPTDNQNLQDLITSLVDGVFLVASGAALAGKATPIWARGWVKGVSMTPRVY